MKKRFVFLPILFAAVVVLCQGNGFAESQPMSDNVKDYEVLRQHIFNTDNNAADPNYPKKIYIMYISTDIVGKESITVHNNSGEQVDVSHWTLGNSWNPTAYLIPQGVTLYQGNMRVFSNPGLGFQFYNKGDKIYLEDDSGAIVDTWENK